MEGNLECTSCHKRFRVLNNLANGSYCIDCFNEIGEKILSEIDPQKLEYVSAIEKEMLIQIYLLASVREDYEFNCPWGLGEMGIIEGIEGNGDDCPGCKYRFENKTSYLKYILDFALSKEGKGIDIELDGWKFHKDRKEYDLKRDEFMEKNGWVVLRFSSNKVFKNPSSIIKEIEVCMDG